jgi:hypothetical protein
MEATMAEVERPEGCTDEVLEYLDALRESGVTNMFGAGPYLREDFTVTQAVAHKWLAYWMKTFSERSRQTETKT